VPNDGLDDTAAIQQAVMDDQNGVISCVWIPAGQWRQEQKILTPDPTRGQYNQKGIRNAVIKGAGMWYSQLYTTTEPQNVTGNINHPHEGNVGFDIDDNTQISDLAIFGMTTNRANRGHGINGRLGKNTKISNVWIEHVNVGAWVGRDYSDTPAGWLSMTADLVRVDPAAKTGYVGDWKTGDGSNATPQLRTLAVAVARTFGLEVVHVEALEVGCDGVRTVCAETLDAFALAAHAGALAEAIAAIPNAEPNPGRHCGDLYCPARATCPSVTSIVAEVIPPEALVRHKWGIQITSPDHAAWLYEQAKAVEAAAKQVKDVVKAYVPAEGLTLEDGALLIEATRMMPRFNRERAVGLMRALGASDEQIESCTVTSSEGNGLKRVGGEKATKARKKKAA